MEIKPRTIVKLVLRGKDVTNPDHHLWDNNGTYWMYYTVHYSDRTAERVRRALKTKDRTEARRRRNAILASLQCSHANSSHPYRGDRQQYTACAEV